MTERRTVASRLYRAMSRISRSSAVLTVAIGWTLVAMGAAPPAAGGAVTQDHADLVVIFFGSLLGLAGTLTALTRWVIDPAIAKALAAHQGDEKAHGIHELRQGRERNRESIEQIRLTLAVIAAHLDVPKHRLPPGLVELASEEEDS